MGSDGSFEVVRGAQIERFKSWTEWPPWEGIDPKLERTCAGPESGVGSRYAWKGTRKVGEGRIVTWRMRGKRQGLMKIMDTFFKIDKMVGPDFEKGLAQLKTVAESKS
ncbi:MAG: hypothetical protein ACSLFF_02665 [Solirubrobacterales bacterium]